MTDNFDRYREFIKLCGELYIKRVLEQSNQKVTNESSC